MKSSFRFFLPFTGWLILSFILLTLPGSALPHRTWLDAIWFDKWVHIGMFAIMSFLLCLAFYKKGIEVKKLNYYFIWAAVICLAYGIGMEFVQKNYVANRSFDGGDIIADGIGCFAGSIYSWWRYIKK